MNIKQYVTNPKIWAAITAVAALFGITATQVQSIHDLLASLLAVFGM